MGSKPVPDYADIFTAKKLDVRIKDLAKSYSHNDTSPMLLLKRFLDDLFTI